MAKFKAVYPTDLIKELDELSRNTEIMLGEMTKAGANIVLNNIRANAPSSFADSNIMSTLKITRTYKGKSDDSINNKIAFYGYFKNSQGQMVPAPIVAQMTEYGGKTRKYPKRPFLRKSFKKAQIEKAMLQVQEKYIKGD